MRRAFDNLVKNWPFCARCRKRRWTMLALATAAAFVPFVVGFGLTMVLATDDTEIEAAQRAYPYPG